MARVVGAKQKRHGALMRFLGLREIGAGIMILSGARAAGCWSRVAGDLMDLALLGADLGTPGTEKGKAIGSTAAVVGVTVLDALTAWELSQSGSGAYDVRVEKSITVNKSPEECYAFWHDFENLPKFMLHLQSVRPTGERRTHWIANGPAGVKVEWDAEITNDRPNECISWRSLENSDIDNSGTVRFERAAGGRGTIVRVTMYYSPPAAGIGDGGRFHAGAAPRAGDREGSATVQTGVGNRRGRDDRGAAGGPRVGRDLARHDGEVLGGEKLHASKLLARKTRYAGGAGLRSRRY